MVRNRNMRLFTSVAGDTEGVHEAIKALELKTTDQVRAVLEFVRKDVLYFLKGYTSASAPARYQKKYTLDANQKRIKLGRGDTRPLHPGGWADVTEDLKKRYYTELEFENNGWRLSVGNRSGHAVYVEAMDGLFVVHGVMEPRGPVARSIRKALRALGVKWVVKGQLAADDELPGLHVTPARGKTAEAPETGDDFT